MTIGTAIVIVMLLYLLDKYGLLRRAAGVVAALATLALVSIFAYPHYEQWQQRREAMKLAEAKANLIAKYQKAVPVTPPGYKVDQEQSAPLEELDKISDKNALHLSDICKEPLFLKTDQDERDQVLSKVWPSHDIFDRIAFIQSCQTPVAQQ